MRKDASKVEPFRIQHPSFPRATGMQGAFRIPRKDGTLLVISSGPATTTNPDLPTSWEHVSVSLPDRVPTWDDMCRVKDLWWGSHECVIQYHPPRAEYVDDHPFVLHLWKPPIPIRTPPKRCV